jgi:hypothetical protein
MEADVRAKLTLLIGAAAPAALRFAPGPVPEPAGPAASAERPPAPSAEDVSAATAITAGIQDPELREAVRRAVSASLARDRGGRPV